MSLHPDGSWDVTPQGAQENLWPGVEGDEVFNRDCFELGLRAADAVVVEGMGDTTAIEVRCRQAYVEALVRL